tara:strand:+ start:161 stop:1087 length:927 start_codon:yes stop_codon:yes gene_type:complete
MKKKNFLVTGVAGFIGSKLAEKLLINGYKVTGVDDFSSGYKKNIPKGVRFIKGNFSDKNFLKRLNLKQFDIIFHIGGQSSGAISFDDPLKDLKDNVVSTVNILEFIKNTKTKFIYASSVAVYGNINKKKLKISDKCQPVSIYGVGKLSSEMYMRVYSETYNNYCFAFRIFNTFGEGQDLKNLRQGMISIYFSQAFYRSKILVRGSKNRFRDYIHVDDVTDALIKAINYNKKKFEIFNICTEKKTKVYEILNFIKEYFNDKIYIRFGKKTLGDQFGVIGSNIMTKKKLNWKPRINLERGLTRFFNYYLK